MAIPSITSTPTPTTATTSATKTPSPATTQETSTQDAATRVTLSNLSEQAGIVSTLGNSDSGFKTYDATGLLNAVAEAGMAQAGTATPTSTDPAASTDTSAGSSTSVAAAVPGDWGAFLKSIPALTSVAVDDAVAQGFVNTINVYV
ncbi:MAG: hypothetical protein ACJ8HJ_31285 [Massilia sp.]